MTIWVDADSCARLAREVLECTCTRFNLELIYVCNRPIRQVKQGGEVKIHVVPNVDIYLIQTAQRGDLCVTRDISLAQNLLRKGSAVINDKGEVATVASLEKRSREGFWNQTLNQAGLIQDKRSTYSSQDKRQFALSLDQWIAYKTK